MIQAPGHIGRSVVEFLKGEWFILYGFSVLFKYFINTASILGVLEIELFRSQWIVELVKELNAVLSF